MPEISPEPRAGVPERETEREMEQDATVLGKDEDPIGWYEF